MGGKLINKTSQASQPGTHLVSILGLPTRQPCCYGIRCNRCNRCNRSHPSHLEALIPAQLHPPLERCEPDRSRRRARNAEERMVRLRMQIHVLLQRAAVRTVIGEIAVLVRLAVDLPERAPGRE